MNVNITYIGHSGFLAELDTCYLLFDYYKGSIPELNKEKKLFVFVSHSHPDHFNPEIFRLHESHPDIMYFISYDIKLNDHNMAGYGITKELFSKIRSAEADSRYEISEKGLSLTVTTLKSTDKGVAYIINYKDKTFYHAGDLNLWVWKEESKQYNNNMRANFNKELSKMKGQNIDIAFVPLDPRQEEWYGLGLDEFLNCVNVKYVFPMHFWDRPEIIKKYKMERENQPIKTSVMDVEKQGQCWNINI